MTERGLDRVFNRIPEFDEQSRQYPARALVAPSVGPRSYTWGVPPLDGSRPLDQGSEGACVGFAWAHEAAARPVVRNDADEALALQVYREAQKIDQWAGENYQGTSVLAGAKTMQRLGYLGEYRWAFGLEEALTVVSRYGPAVLGIPWYSSMYETEKGWIRVDGEQVGGHAILLHGVNVRGQYARLYNSWGPDWSPAGSGKISFADLGRLLREDGECCVPVRRLPLAGSPLALARRAA